MNGLCLLLAQSVNITPIIMVNMLEISIATIAHRLYKPAFKKGGDPSFLGYQTSRRRIEPIRKGMGIPGSQNGGILVPYVWPYVGGTSPET